jgi:glycerol-3-phosphate dehydrogenase (NAD(P)+)
MSIKVGVLGAGSWGTALALVLLENGHEVTLWTHSEKSCERMKESRKLSGKLPQVYIPKEIVLTSFMEEAVVGKELIVLAVPSTAVRETAEKMRPYIEKGQIVVSVSKGFEEHTLLTLTQVIEEVLPQAEACALCGPSHAEEVIASLPTALVAGAKKKSVAEKIQSTFMNAYLRVYTCPDVLGMEIGGALKNVLALAAGMADGLGYGDNTKAALITRGMAELIRLSEKMGANPVTMNGLTGMGDLIVTCQSRHSRNRKAGMLIGQGKTLVEAEKKIGMVVEGANSARAAKLLAEKYGVSMPIVTQVNAVLFDGKKAEDAVGELMLRDRRMENTTMHFEEE